MSTNPVRRVLAGTGLSLEQDVAIVEYSKDDELASANQRAEAAEITVDDDDQGEGAGRE